MKEGKSKEMPEFFLTTISSELASLWQGSQPSHSSNRSIFTAPCVAMSWRTPLPHQQFPVMGEKSLLCENPKFLSKWCLTPWLEQKQDICWEGVKYETRTLEATSVFLCSSVLLNIQFLAHYWIIAEYLVLIAFFCIICSSSLTSEGNDNWVGTVS